MAVKKNNATTADDQETKVGGNVVTVNHNSSEPLVTVAVQNNTPAIAQQVTVVVNFKGNEEQNGSKTEGDTLRSPPKINQWSAFQMQYKGKKLTRQEVSALHHQNMKKQHASLTTDGS